MGVRKVSVGKVKHKKPATTKRKVTHRKRRIGATSNLMGLVIDGALVGGGIVGGRILNGVIVKQAPTFSAFESGLVQFGGGLALAMFIKNPYAMKVGLGLMGQAVAVELVAAGVIQGIGATDRMSYRVNRVNGVGNRQSLISGNSQTRISGGGQTRIGDAGRISVINGASDISVVNGIGAVNADGRTRCS